MSKERLAEVASRGGKAAHASGHGHIPTDQEREKAKVEFLKAVKARKKREERLARQRAQRKRASDISKAVAAEQDAERRKNRRQYYRLTP